jgi:hypothetical protein
MLFLCAHAHVMNEFLKTAGVTNVYKNPSFEQRKWQCFGEDLPQGLLLSHRIQEAYYLQTRDEQHLVTSPLFYVSVPRTKEGAHN